MSHSKGPTPRRYRSRLFHVHKTQVSESQLVDSVVVTPYSLVVNLFCIYSIRDRARFTVTEVHAPSVFSIYLSSLSVSLHRLALALTLTFNVEAMIICIREEILFIATFPSFGFRQPPFESLIVERSLSSSNLSRFLAVVFL